MYNFDKFKSDESEELAEIVAQKFATQSGMSLEDIKQLAYHVGLFALIAADKSEFLLLVSTSGEPETIVNPLYKED